MRLLFFSPLARSSAIARVTELVVDALAEQGGQVTLVRSEDSAQLELAARPIDAPVLHWNERSRVLAAAAVADAIVYQVGDNYEFHRGCVEWLPVLPGMVCLHDYFLGSLFRRWARGHPSEADAVLRAWYGDAIARRYFSFHDPAVFVEKTAIEAPMTEWIASQARAIVTHSSWGIARLLVACPGPTRVVPLPYDAPAIHSRPGEARTDGAGARDGFTLLTVGHVNANKRVDSVIRAIGESERLREATTYRLVGRIDGTMGSALNALAQRYGVRLRIDGELSDDDLRAAIEDCDAVCALRLPALESASASAIEAMLYGKPVIVMETGFYQELPDDVVRKVSPVREIDDIRRVLDELAADASTRRALGAAAAIWAARTFRADIYASNLLDLAVDAAVAAPALEAAKFFAETLHEWGATSKWPPPPEMVEPLRILERREAMPR